MHLLNDFFLLSWSENSDSIEDTPDDTSKAIYETYRSNYEEFYQSCSILFIINSENFEKIVKIEEFKELFGGVFQEKTVQKCLVLQVQKKVLEFIVELGNLELNNRLKSSFEILRKEGIISYYVSRRLIGLLGLIREKEDKREKIHLQIAKSCDNFYKNSLEILKVGIKNLTQCIESTILINRLNQIDEKLKNEKFSIGVTGIINSGKSTMLNALLKEEILGTAVVPETANLTILKYSKQRYAEVNFWSRSEFSKIEKSATEIKSIEKFIHETKEEFGDKLNLYIREESRKERVEIEDLALFTSAQKSDKKCNLIKSVELYSDLEFLKDGVEIVDTPGLDDPVIQREEITLSYISECDLMIHLMNVNQSATQKDIDFIIDSILYQNIARLLIVITRIDTVSKEELDEVISYTKKSIEERLKKQHKSHKFKTILGKLDFIPISGKAALFLRTGREDEAREMGYTLENCGILSLQRYLSSVLFGCESEKANLIIQKNQNELLYIINQQRDRFDKELVLLNRSVSQIKKEYELHQEKRQKILSKLSQIKKNIKKQERELREYFKILHKFSDTKLVNLRDLIKSRVIDDVSYEIRKNRRFPEKERIEYIVQNGIKDGLIDLMQDYRFEFQKKMQESFEVIKKDFKDDNSEYNLQEYGFDAREFFQREFKLIALFQNMEILHVKIYENIKKYAKISIEKLDTQLQILLKNSMDELKTALELKLEKINTTLLSGFIEISQNGVEKEEQEINMHEDLLKTTMQNIKKHSLNKKQRVDEIREKMDALEFIKKELSSFGRGDG